jgi:acetyl-CoA acetyltransferase
MSDRSSELVDLSGRVAVVGATDLVSQTGELAERGRPLQARVVAAALADAGLTLADVDGIAVAGGPLESLQLSEYLGLRPRWTDTTQIGGASFEAHVEHAVAALAAGLADVVVVSYAATPRSDAKRGLASPRRPEVYGPDLLEFEAPYGLTLPLGPYALAADRHRAQYGTTAEQLAAIAVSTRQWAELNPSARMREPLTVADVVAAPRICGDLGRYDCCLVTDGAAAVVLTRADRAVDLGRDPIWVRGVASAHSHNQISQMADLTVTPGAVSGPAALRMAGVDVTDIDVFEIYDSFTITVLLALEDLGLCAKGDGGAFVADGRLGPGGAVPANTTGGGLSYTHPGMFGLFLIVEAVRQLRGEAGPRQVPDARLAVAHGCGGVLSATSTVVLGCER